MGRAIISESCEMYFLSIWRLSSPVRVSLRASRILYPPLAARSKLKSPLERRASVVSGRVKASASRSLTWYVLAESRISTSPMKAFILWLSSMSLSTSTWAQSDVDSGTSVTPSPCRSTLSSEHASVAFMSSLERSASSEMSPRTRSLTLERFTIALPSLTVAVAVVPARSKSLKHMASILASASSDVLEEKKSVP